MRKPVPNVQPFNRVAPSSGSKPSKKLQTMGIGGNFHVSGILEKCEL
jgi:hypothetical protein